MRKILLLLLTLTLSAAVSAQTMKEVCKKCIETDHLTEGLKGTVSMKFMGIGGSVEFETDGKNMRLFDDDDVIYLNDSTVYAYEKDKNTITISNDEQTKAFLMPYFIVYAISEGKTEKIDSDALNMKKEKNEYIIRVMQDKKEAMQVLIDAKTYHLKGLKAKKGFITIMSITYKDHQPFDDVSSLVFDASKFPNAKIKDERTKNGK